MKPILRKIFYWDNPAQGAFFHASLLLTLPWMAYAIWCFLVPFLLGLPSLSLAGVLLCILLLIAPAIAGIEAFFMAVCLVRLAVGWRQLRKDGIARSRLPMVVVALVVLFWLSEAVFFVWFLIGWSHFVGPMMIATLAGYFCLAYGLARLQEINYKSLFTKSIVRLWKFFAVAYVLVFCLAFFNHLSARRNCEEVETYFGHQPTCEARDEWIAKECVIDMDFWKKAQEILQRRPKPEGFSTEDDELASAPNIEWTSPYITKWTEKELEYGRRRLMKIPDLEVLEEMFDAPVPQCLYKNLWNDIEAKDTMRIVFQFERWRLFFALEDKDAEGAMARCRCLFNILLCFMELGKRGANCGFRSYNRYYLKSLEEIASSRLLSDAQLGDLLDGLQKLDDAYMDVRKGMVYGMAIRYKNEFHLHDGSFWGGEAPPVIYQLFCQFDVVESGHWERRSPLRQLQQWLCRIAIPQFWWRAANEKRIVAKMLMDEDLDWAHLNRKGSVIALIDFNWDAWSWSSKDVYRREQARKRAVVGAIEVLRAYGKAGEYPEVLPATVEDPFTGETMKYRVGECLQHEYYPITTITEIQAIQVWSVGPNKTDDDGLDFDLAGDYRNDKYHRRDDIRCLIPIQDTLRP